MNTKVRFKLFVDSLLVPTVKSWVKDGLPLEEAGGTLIGYGVALLRQAGKSNDQIREVLESAITGKPPVGPPTDPLD